MALSELAKKTPEQHVVIRNAKANYREGELANQ
jgi:hypothetical protein